MKPLSILILTLAHQTIQLFRRIFQPNTLGVRIILLNANMITCVRHTYMDKNNWYFPGGGLNRGETPEQAARREAWEEAGVNVGSVKLVGVYPNPAAPNSDTIIVYASTSFQIRPDLQPFHLSQEIAACTTFPLDLLPSNMAVNHKQWVLDFLQHNS